MTFVRADLLADISEDELSGRADELVATGDPDPVATAIAESQAKMERFIHRYVVDDNWQKQLLRPLVLWEIYKRLGKIQDKRQKAYDETMKTLREIRDGKFKDLPLKDPQPTDSGAGQGRSGSVSQINTSRMATT